MDMEGHDNQTPFVTREENEDDYNNEMVMDDYVKLEDTRDGLFVSRKSSSSNPTSYIYNSKSFVAPYTTEKTRTTRFIDDQSESLPNTQSSSSNIPTSSLSASSTSTIHHWNAGDEQRKAVWDELSHKASTSLKVMDEVFHGQVIELPLFYKNITTVCQFGCLVHLNYNTVLQTTAYWLSEYSNKSIPEQSYLKAIIQGIYSYPPIVELAGHYGLKYEADLQASYCLLMRFIGPVSHSVPSAYYTKNENSGILNAFSYFVHPDTKSFISPSSCGLKSEVQIENFHYDQIMQNFFEPSYYVLTCIVSVLDFMNYRLIKSIFSDLQQVKKGVYKSVEAEVDAKIHEVVNSLRQLLLDIEPKDLLCFRSGVDDEKIARFMQDILAIVHVIQTSIHDFKLMNDRMIELWKEKTEYCLDEMVHRTRKVLDIMCSERL